MGWAALADGDIVGAWRGIIRSDFAVDLDGRARSYATSSGANALPLLCDQGDRCSDELK